jgi:hypothetical protein
MLPHVSLLRRRRKPTVETCVDNNAKLRPQASVLALRAAGAIYLLNPASTTTRSYGRRIGPGTTAMYMQRTTSGAAGNGLYTTIKYMSGAAGNGLGSMIKYLRRATSAAANNSLSTTINPPCNAAAFVVNSDLQTGARPSVRLCVGPELARCVHYFGAH